MTWVAHGNRTKPMSSLLVVAPQRQVVGLDDGDVSDK